METLSGPSIWQFEWNIHIKSAIEKMSIRIQKCATDNMYYSDMLTKPIYGKKLKKLISPFMRTIHTLHIKKCITPTNFELNLKHTVVCEKIANMLC